MDYLSAISLASNVIQFIGIATKIIDKSYELYGSQDRALRQNVEIGEVAHRLAEASKTLRTTPLGLLSSFSDGSKPYDHFLKRIASSCHAVANELLEVLSPRSTS